MSFKSFISILIEAYKRKREKRRTYKFKGGFRRGLEQPARAY